MKISMVFELIIGDFIEKQFLNGYIIIKIIYNFYSIDCVNKEIYLW